jgi:aspartate/methionine/tyrosine aminotransferase
MFSSRGPNRLVPNRVARAVSLLRSSGAELIDLTESNPTRVGLRYPDDLLGPLNSSRAFIYEPAPLGLPVARGAVAAYLRRQGFAAEPPAIVLTSSTSEAYANLFKLLCDPGDAVLVPSPSYPLFDHLTRFEGIKAVPYALEYHGHWEINLPSLRAGLTSRTRAILVVNPNNPTGGYISTRDLEAVVSVSRERDLALIADEVFGAYPIADRNRGPSVLDRPAEVLTFTLGGLSKAVGLPQLKLGWIVASGPPALVDQALKRLEVIADTYLSVATPVQLAAATILDVGTAITAQIAARVRQNHATLKTLVSRHLAAQLLEVEGGWYAVVHVPATRSEETLILELLEHERVLVHPGYFYDFPREAFLVMSLLPDPSVFEEAVGRTLAWAADGM